MLPHPETEIPEAIANIVTATGPRIELEGFLIRQETRYSDGRFIWMELSSDEGRNLEGPGANHQLTNVRVKVVSRQGDKSQGSEVAVEEEGEGEGGFNTLSDRANIAWVLIQGATGIYSFETRNIELRGNVQVYGYAEDGKITEWISTERLFYEWKAGMVRTLELSTYEGLSLFPGQPCRCFLEADVGLNEISINDFQTLDPEEFHTPVRDETMRPLYDPPEALVFVRKILNTLPEAEKDPL